MRVLRTASSRTALLPYGAFRRAAGIAGLSGGFVGADLGRNTVDVKPVGTTHPLAGAMQFFDGVAVASFDSPSR